MTISSRVPLISRVNRTQRLHITQRSTNSVTVAPMLAAAAGERADVGPPLRLAVLEMIILQADIRPPCRRSGNRSDDRSAGLLRPCARLCCTFSLLVTNDGAVFGRRLAGRHELGHHRDRAGLGIARARFRPGTCGNWPRPSGPDASSSSGMSMPARSAAWMPLSRSLRRRLRFAVNDDDCP